MCSNGKIQLDELLEAVAINEGDTELDRDSVPDEVGVMKWCSSLVRKSPDGDKLELAHFTVEEFLRNIDESNKRYAKYRIMPEYENFSIAKLCLTYLGFKNFAQVDWTVEDNFRKAMTEYPFFNYASHNWFRHAEPYRQDESLLDMVKILLDPLKSNNFMCWSTCWMWKETGMYNLNLISDMETLHFAASLSYTGICQWLIQEKDRLGDIDKLSRVGTPLFCALVGNGIFNWNSIDPDWHKGDRQQTLEYLLKTGAKVNQTQCHPRLSFTVLSFAFYKDLGWKILLQNGALLDKSCIQNIEDLRKENKGSVVERFLSAVEDQNLTTDIRPL
jgi:hypothetical protein